MDSGRDSVAVLGTTLRFGFKGTERVDKFLVFW